MKNKEPRQVTKGLMIIVGLLLVISVVQAGQIYNIKNEVSGKVTKTVSSGQSDEQTPKVSPARTPVTAPTMVGGC